MKLVFPPRGRALKAAFAVPREGAGNGSRIKVKKFSYFALSCNILMKYYIHLNNGIIFSEGRDAVFISARASPVRQSKTYREAVGMEAVKAPRGTRDILGDESWKWAYVTQICRNVADDYGYREVHLPIFEHTELFCRGVGETTDVVEKEMYTFTDKGGRSITLRPELTASMVRSYLENEMNKGTQPAKLWSIARRRGATVSSYSSTSRRSARRTPLLTWK